MSLRCSWVGVLQAWGWQLGVTRIGIWPLWRAFHLTCPRVAGTGLAYLAGLIRSLSADGGVTRHRCAAW